MAQSTWFVQSNPAYQLKKKLKSEINRIKNLSTWLFELFWV